jgi:hypothetical protein
MQLTTTIDPAVAKVVGVVFHADNSIAEAFYVTEEGVLTIAQAGGIIPADGVVATVQLQLTSPSSQFTLVADGAVNGNEASSIDAVEVVELPTEFALLGNYPNPFNPTTTISFDLPEAAQVSVEVYDAIGRRVMALPAEAFSAGSARSIQLNALQLSSGTYFYRVIARSEKNTKVETGRMLLVK